MAEQQSSNGPEMIRGIVETLTGHNAEVTYEFDNIEVHIPGDPSSNVRQSPWKINGTLRIRTGDANFSGDHNQGQRR